MASSRAAVVVFLLALSVCGGAVDSAGGLSWDFHETSCPDLGHIVKYHVGEAFRRDVGIAPALVRILFHDCFPQGCDASVLLNVTASELLELPNQTLRPTALSLIDDIRAAVHRFCGPVVSCADITALATRDALVAAGGPTYEIPLGRRDGLAPASRALVGTLPAPFFDVPALIKSFKDRNLTTADLVSLSGAHTIGHSHCPSFNDRFPPSEDPTIDPEFSRKLQAKCAKDVPTGTVTQVNDVRTPDVFDNKYYFDLIARQGLFKSDQGLIDHGDTKRMATRFALNQGAFFDQFAASMVKMSSMDVLTGTQGEIRLSCSVPNKRAGDDGLAAEM